jgi:hypothetical protein
MKLCNPQKKKSSRQGRVLSCKKKHAKQTTLDTNIKVKQKGVFRK